MPGLEKRECLATSKTLKIPLIMIYLGQSERRVKREREGPI